MSTPEADLLKVAASASLAELKQAYRKAALAAHPDQNPHPEAARHFRRVTEAYRLLEAQALLREPRRPRVVPLTDRLEFVLNGVGELLRRWPADRWEPVTEGLPAAVWVASILDVLAAHWSASATISPAQPTKKGIENALADWRVLLSQRPLAPSDRRGRKSLEAALRAAEARLRALDRPTRGRPL